MARSKAKSKKVKIHQSRSFTSCSHCRSAKLRHQLGKRIAAHIPGAFKRVIQISDHKAGKQKQHADDHDGSRSQDHIMKWIAEHQEHDGEAREAATTLPRKHGHALGPVRLRSRFSSGRITALMV